MHRPIWEAMLNATEVGSGTRFLDAGGGGGGASILAAERGAQVSGLDAAESGSGPFELSAPGTLEGLFAEAGLRVLESGEADCTFIFEAKEKRRGKCRQSNVDKRRILEIVDMTMTKSCCVQKEGNT